MLLLPYLIGVVAAGPRWPHLPLLVAWLAGYLLSYYALQAVKSRRPARYRDQLLLYGLSATLPAAVVVAARPAVLIYAPVFAVLLALNAWYAWCRRERALLNDLVSVVQSCLMVPVAATVAGVPAGDVAVPCAAALLYFTGTVLYVKTMIRERGSRAYHRASVAYHLAAVAVAGWLSIPLAVLFGVLAVRAAALPRRRLTPKQVGLLEIGACVLLGGALVVA
ncbi:YwiC-like protein [Actinoplanes teichomyceticus]|uniref:YwiC-like protein n=2 Tax=Actinoplanes teichomyceticus TaxID=1867 RepID=A0A561VLL1_ACTTI|nr:YwiC-like protein [Actinoplanes teichomyceticus]